MSLTHSSLLDVYRAFGAHGLRTIVTDPAKIKFWENASHWQIVRSVYILASLTVRTRTRKRLGPGKPPENDTDHSGSVVSSLVPARIFAVGISMFSGTLYCLTLSPGKLKWMAPLAPMGGCCLIAGWVAQGLVKRGEGRGA